MGSLSLIAVVVVCSTVLLALAIVLRHLEAESKERRLLDAKRLLSEGQSQALEARLKAVEDALTRLALARNMAPR